MSAKQTWYFTFGAGQPFANRFFVVRDATYDEARQRMLDAFGQNWGLQYDEAGWNKGGISQAEKYNLTEIR